MMAAVAACAADRYAGVDLRPGRASAEVQALAARARSGDKQAQYMLGERFERGEGVPRDAAAATRLYRAAATTSGGTRIIFVPQAKGGVSAVPVNTGAAVPGLAAARAKLAEMPASTVRDYGTSPASGRRGRVRAAGRLVALGPSDACTAHRAAVQAASAFRIATCSAQRYRFEPRRGAALAVIDLALTTDDEEASSTLPIPFGLFDALELRPEGAGGAMGTVTYEVQPTVGGTINILRRFEPGRRAGAGKPGSPRGRVAPLLRACAPDRSGDAEGCAGGRGAMLWALAQTELNFKPCRVRDGLGNAGQNPRSYIFNAVDAERGVATRACLYATEPVTELLTNARATLVLLWLDLLEQAARCAAADCAPAARTDQLGAVMRLDVPDSLLRWAAADALWRSAAVPEVGTGWWWTTCRTAATRTGVPLNMTEQQLCRVAGYRWKREAA